MQEIVDINQCEGEKGEERKEGRREGGREERKEGGKEGGREGGRERNEIANLHVVRKCRCQSM